MEHFRRLGFAKEIRGPFTADEFGARNRRGSAQHRQGSPAPGGRAHGLRNQESGALGRGEADQAALSRRRRSPPFTPALVDPR
jgi:hypothetical protein